MAQSHVPYDFSGEDQRRRPLVIFIPELNNSGGTERATAQCIRRWATERRVVVYTRRCVIEVPPNVEVRLIRLVQKPQLVGWLLFVAWSSFVAAHLRRSSTRPIVFSPGANLVGADVTVAHIYYRQTLRVLAQDVSPGQIRQRFKASGSLRKLHSALYARAVQFLEATHYRRSRFVYAVSSLERQAMEADGLQVDGIAPNGVDLNEFTFELRQSIGKFRVLCVGSEIKKKGLDLLVSAFEDSTLRSEADVTIVTRSRNEEELTELAAAVGLDRFRVVTESKSASVLYRDSDVYVAASREDSFNMPALEAMASGLPVVMTNRCGLSEWALGAALVVAPNPAAIGTALRRLHASPSLVSSLSSAGRRLAEAMSWDAAADVIAESFEALDFALRDRVQE